MWLVWRVAQALQRRTPHHKPWTTVKEVPNPTGSSPVSLNTCWCIWFVLGAAMLLRGWLGADGWVMTWPAEFFGDGRLLSSETGSCGLFGVQRKHYNAENHTTNRGRQ